jgi:hypothetical protein
MSLNQFALARGRAAAESRMTSRCTIRRKTSATTTDPDGFQIPVWEDVHVDLMCWVDREGAGSTAPVNINVGGGVEFSRARRVLKIPHDATQSSDNNVAKVSGGACDGKFFRLTEVTFADQKKQQEIPIIEIERPEGWV